VHRLIFLLKKAKFIYKTEGLMSLLRNGFTFLVGCVFKCRYYYLYEHTMKQRNETDFLPKIKAFDFQIVTTSQQADELEAKGFDLRSLSPKTKKCLDRGAFAFCILIGNEVAHVSWVAMTAEAKKAIEPIPYPVDFSNKEACTSNTITAEKYQGNGLMTYGKYKVFEFLREKGIMIVRNGIDTQNIASQRVHAKFGPRIYAKARYLYLMGLQFRKMIPLVSDQPSTGNHETSKS